MSVPLERLTAHDLYRLLGYVADRWDGDEAAMTRRLQELRELLSALPEPHADDAAAMLDALERARLVEGAPWRSAIVALRAIVAEWDRSRPPLIVCGVDGCGISHRSPERIERHRQLVHGEAATVDR